MLRTNLKTIQNMTWNVANVVADSQHGTIFTIFERLMLLLYPVILGMILE